MSEYDEHDEELLGALVKGVRSAYGSNVLSMISGGYCNMGNFGDVAEAIDSPEVEQEQVLFVAAVEGFSLTRTLLESLPGVQEPDGNGAITGLAIDADWIDVTDEGITPEQIGAYLQGGINLNMDDLVRYVLNEGPTLAVEFVHMVVHVVASSVVEHGDEIIEKITKDRPEAGAVMNARWN